LSPEGQQPDEHWKKKSSGRICQPVTRLNSLHITRVDLVEKSLVQMDKWKPMDQNKKFYPFFKKAMD